MPRAVSMVVRTAFAAFGSATGRTGAGGAGGGGSTGGASAPGFASGLGSLVVVGGFAGAGRDDLDAAGVLVALGVLGRSGTGSTTSAASTIREGGGGTIRAGRSSVFPFA